MTFCVVIVNVSLNPTPSTMSPESLKDEFYRTLRSIKGYDEKVDYLFRVTHSHRTAMLWLVIKEHLAPSEESRYLSRERLEYLWQHMNKPRLGSDQEKQLQIQVLVRWFNLLSDSEKRSAQTYWNALDAATSLNVQVFIFDKWLETYLNTPTRE